MATASLLPPRTPTRVFLVTMHRGRNVGEDSASEPSCRDPYLHVTKNNHTTQKGEGALSRGKGKTEGPETGMTPVQGKGGAEETGCIVSAQRGSFPGVALDLPFACPGTTFPKELLDSLCTVCTPSGIHL